MSEPDPKRVEDLFQRALDAPGERREPLLREACGEDGPLRQAVERLLNIHDRGLADLMQTPMFATAPAAVAKPDSVLPARIGRYEIIRKVGEGGMGIVYEARQEYPHRTVALKVIRAPAFGGLPASVLARFQHEAEILGQLQHPGIAQIYEAGMAEVCFESAAGGSANSFGGFPVRRGGSPSSTPISSIGPDSTFQAEQQAASGASSAGRSVSPVPFFAMEFVRGRPLHEHAAAKGLGTRERMALVAQICDAVHYAHTQGVIHRDLKPANILVVCDDDVGRRTDDSALPKILDFGVARTTDADMQTVTLRTDVGQLIGTIPYMSPEQVMGDSRQLDARADVYALGVILYELLSGRLPHDVRHQTIPEAVRIIREAEPTRLSSINPLFRGDIETIVSKALEKDKARRYAYAAELAADIRRYLRDEPIVARPASALYQMRKFARRNRGVVIATVLLFVILVAGITITSLLFVRAERHRGQAVASADSARRQAYQAGIAAAQAGLGNHDLPLARRALDGTPETLRGWEWRYLDWLAERGGRVLNVSDSQSASICVSRSATSIAVHRPGSGIEVWDAGTGAIQRTLAPSVEHLSSLALSPDGSLLAVRLASDEPPVGLWDVASGQELWRRERVAGLWPDAFSPDGSRITMVFDDSIVRTVDARTGGDLMTGSLPRRTEGGVVASPDGSRILATVDRYTLACLEPATSRVLWSRQAGYAGFSPDGKHVWWHNNTHAGVVETETGRDTLQIDGIGGPIQSAGLSPDGAILATRERSTAIVLRDSRSGGVAAVLEAEEPTAPHYSNEGRWLVGAGSRSVRIWDAAVCAAPFPIGLYGSVECYTSDGRRALLNEWGMVHLMDLERGGFVWNRVLTRKVIHRLAFSPNERHIFVCDVSGVMWVLDTETGSVVRGPSSLGIEPSSAIWTGDGIAVSSVDGAVRLFDDKDGTVKRVLHQGAAPICLALAPDAMRLACGSNDGQVAVLDLSGDSSPLTLPPLKGGVISLAFGPRDSVLAAGSADGDIVLWENGRERHHFSTDGKSVSALAFHPDGSRLAACVAEDVIQVWDTILGHRTIVLRGNGSWLRSAAFSSDGNSLMVGSAKELIRYETGPPACGFHEREQFRRARALFNVGLLARSPKNQIAEFSRDESLSPSLRETAIGQVRARGANPNYLNSEAWGLVRYAGSDAESYQAGLRHIEAAREVWPEEWAFLNTLGVARYRTGDPGGALGALEHCNALRTEGGGKPHPADVVFMAMAQWKLGRLNEARDSLTRCKQLATDSTYRWDGELRAFIAEAESLISDPP